MQQRLPEIIESTFRLRENEGQSKVIPLAEAIRRQVKPGMTLHMAPEAGASICEIIRQFWGSRPNFTLSQSMVGGTHAVSLMHAGLVKKLVFTNCADTYPAPSPNPVIQRAFRQKTMELENWSVLCFELRLIAGALGIGFIPTKSMIGSDVALENREDYQVIDDPFGSGRKLGLLRATNPDLALIHAWAADPYGNTITPCTGVSSSVWGAKASRNGVLVSVERLVSTDFIRQHSHLVRIPGYLVNSVSVVPFAAHPHPMPSIGLAEFDGYVLDTQYIMELRKASEDPAAMDAWIKEWVLEVESHDDYLRKLGPERLLFLKGKLYERSWEYELAPQVEGILSHEGYNRVEMMLATASRKIQEIVRQRGYKILFPGIGLSGLPGWLAYYLLQKDGYHVDLVPMGIGFSPRPADPFMMSMANVQTAKALPDIIDIHGTCVTGETSSCLGIIGAGQIDKRGNVNSSKIGEETFLAGIAGGNDIASAAREVVVVTIQSRERFLERVPYISQPGERIKTLISTRGIFEKLGDDPEFTLTMYFPDPKLSTAEEHIEQIKANCGWELKVAKDVGAATAPSSEELLLLRALDPKGAFIGK